MDCVPLPIVMNGNDEIRKDELKKARKKFALGEGTLFDFDESDIEYCIFHYPVTD